MVSSVWLDCLFSLFIWRLHLVELPVQSGCSIWIYSRFSLAIWRVNLVIGCNKNSGLPKFAPLSLAVHSDQFIGWGLSQLEYFVLTQPGASHWETIQHPPVPACHGLPWLSKTSFLHIFVSPNNPYTLTIPTHDQSTLASVQYACSVCHRITTFVMPASHSH